LLDISVSLLSLMYTIGTSVPGYVLLPQVISLRHTIALHDILYTLWY